MRSVYAVIRASPLRLRQIQRDICRQREIGSLDHMAGDDLYNLLARFDVCDSEAEERVMDNICAIGGVQGALVLSRIYT